MRPITHLELLWSGLFVVGGIAIHAWLGTGVPETGWAIAFSFCFAMVAWFALLLVMRSAQRPGSKWNKPVSDVAGQRIMSAAVGAWLVLTMLLLVAFEVVAFDKLPGLAVAGAVAFVASFAIARRFVRRGVRHPLMPYAIAATCVAGVFIPFVILGAGIAYSVP